MDEAKLGEFMGRFVTDMSGAAMMASVMIGDELGLYRLMADSEPISADQLAERAGCNPRLTLEWLNAHTARATSNTTTASIGSLKNRRSRSLLKTRRCSSPRNCRRRHVVPGQGQDHRGDARRWCDVVG